MQMCIRDSPDTIKEYRKQLKALETEILEQMKGFYDQFEGELDGHALTADAVSYTHLAGNQVTDSVKVVQEPIIWKQSMELHQNIKIYAVLFKL